jgi:tRNA dimethylallyltransferase
LSLDQIGISSRVTFQSQSIDTVLLAGPTASGKSSAALALAQATGGVIVNADSMQVYRELRVLSARPSQSDEARAPHRLYGFVGVREPFSVAKWLAAIEPALAELRSNKRLAIVTGGTGLYFSALERGLSPIPEIDPEVRSEARQLHDKLGSQAFHAELTARDPRTAGQLHPSDAQRLMRAWEVIEQTGQGLAEWQEIKGKPAIDVARSVRVLITPERDRLYARCDTRFDQMMEGAALEEARSIARLNLDESLPATRALGLRQLLRHLKGELSLEEAVQQAKRDTRRYAKRQLTWFRHQMADWESLVPADEAAFVASMLQRLA